MAGLTPQGFSIKRLQEILVDLETALREEFGSEIVTGPETGFGRLAGVFSKPLAELWELAQAVHSSQYPATADGASLDNVVDLNLLRRLAADVSRAWSILVVDVGTTVPALSQVSHETSGAAFQTQADETPDLSTPVTLARWEISGEPHGVGETYDVVVDGVIETFTTAGGESNQDVAEGIRDLIDQSYSIVAVDQGARSFSVSGDQTARFNLPGRRIRVSDNLGLPSSNGQYTIVSAVFSGGDTEIFVTQAIPSSDVSGEIRWNCEANAGTVGSVTTLQFACIALLPPYLPPGATDAEDFEMAIGFTPSIPANMTLVVLGVAHKVAAVTAGPTEAEVGKLNVIDTPVSGWLATLNTIAADVGRLLETDVELRQRRALLLALATVEGILRALQATQGVDEARVFENPTDATDADGRPPHSVEGVVTGGDDDDVALAIFNSKAAGIQTFGNAIQVVEDSQGFSRSILYSRPVDVPVWVEVTVNSLYAEEELPPFPSEAIKEAVVAAGAAFDAGLDVLPERLNGPIFAAVPGLGSITVRVGLAAPPAVSTSPLAISARQIARFAIDRVSTVGV